MEFSADVQLMFLITTAWLPFF